MRNFLRYLPRKHWHFIPLSKSFTLLPHSLAGKGKCHWVCSARQIACLINFISYHLSLFSLCSRHCLPCSFLFKHVKQTFTLHALYLFSCCLGYHFPDSCKVHFYPTFKSLLQKDFPCLVYPEQCSYRFCYNFNWFTVIARHSILDQFVSILSSLEFVETKILVGFVHSYIISS